MFPASSGTVVPTARSRSVGIVAEGTAMEANAAGAEAEEMLLRRKHSTRGGRSFFQWSFRAKKATEVQHKYVVN